MKLSRLWWPLVALARCFGKAIKVKVFSVSLCIHEDTLRVCITVHLKAYDVNEFLQFQY